MELMAVEDWRTRMMKIIVILCRRVVLETLFIMTKKYDDCPEIKLFVGVPC
jgi:hypothetical protein